MALAMNMNRIITPLIAETGVASVQIKGIKESTGQLRAVKIVRMVSTFVGLVLMSVEASLAFKPDIPHREWLSIGCLIGVILCAAVQIVMLLIEGGSAAEINEAVKRLVQAQAMMGTVGNKGEIKRAVQILNHDSIQKLLEKDKDAVDIESIELADYGNQALGHAADITRKFRNEKAYIIARRGDGVLVSMELSAFYATVANQFGNKMRIKVNDATIFPVWTHFGPQIGDYVRQWRATAIGIKEWHRNRTNEDWEADVIEDSVIAALGTSGLTDVSHGNIGMSKNTSMVDLRVLPTLQPPKNPPQQDPSAPFNISTEDNSIEPRHNAITEPITFSIPRVKRMSSIYPRIDENE